MMDAGNLRKSILQLAVEGRLVEQRAEEGTAKDLLREIAIEREALVKEGKIKKEKTLPEICEEEKPFAIPDSWEWVRLRNLVYNRGQKTPNRKFSYIDIGSINNIHQKLNEKETILEAKDAPSRARKIVEKDDIIYATVRPYLHNTCIIDREFSEEPIASTGFAVLSCYHGVFNKYLLYYLISPEFDKFANATENAKGMAYPAINDKTFYTGLIPLPPLAEQRRIVEKIDALMPLVDEYEKEEQALSKLDAEFPEQVRKSILQEAVSGRLVEQRAEEGTAKELLKEIAKEREALIKAGKIKKEKALPEISEEEKPFAIPDSWEWVRLGEICNILMGQSPDGNSVGLNINGVEFHQGKIEFGKIYINESKIKTNKPAKIAPADSILLCVRAPVGIVNITKREICIGRGLCCLVPLSKVSLMFMFYLLSTYTQIFEKQATGSTFKAINNNIIIKQPVPLPPLAEQRRIVAKVDELMKVIDTL